MKCLYDADKAGRCQRRQVRWSTRKWTFCAQAPFWDRPSGSQVFSSNHCASRNGTWAVISFRIPHPQWDWPWWFPCPLPGTANGSASTGICLHDCRCNCRPSSKRFCTIPRTLPLFHSWRCLPCPLIWRIFQETVVWIWIPGSWNLNWFPWRGSSIFPFQPLRSVIAERAAHSRRWLHFSVIRHWQPRFFSAIPRTSFGYPACIGTAACLSCLPLPYLSCYSSPPVYNTIR